MKFYFRKIGYPKNGNINYPHFRILKFKNSLDRTFLLSVSNFQIETLFYLTLFLYNIGFFMIF